MTYSYKLAFFHLAFVIFPIFCYEGTRDGPSADCFDPKADAVVLQKAVKDIDKNGKAIIIDVITKRLYRERVEISEAYKSLDNINLIDEIKENFSGKLRKLMVDLMTPLPVNYARELHEAALRNKTDDKTIVEILCTVCSFVIRRINRAYEKEYDKSFESDLKGDTSVCLKKLLASRSKLNFDYPDATLEELRADAQNLYIGASEWSTILLTRSYPQLQKIFHEYERISGSKIEGSANKVFNNLDQCLTGIVKSVKSTAEFLSEILYANKPGSEEDDRNFILIVTSRSDVDLPELKEAFEHRYKKSLESLINETTSGDYNRALVSLVSSRTEEMLRKITPDCVSAL